MKKIKVNIKSAGLTLEGIMETDEDVVSGPGVVLCHPHPLYGGSMDNNVLHAVSRALILRGISVLRFNFRGVGNSEGVFDRGKGETDDALAALSFLSRQGGTASPGIGIAGYSFGGAVALAAAEKNLTVKAAAAVSPMEIPEPEDSTRPRLIICGAKDTFIPVAGVLRKKEEMPAPGRIEIIEGADHFWWGFEEEAAGLMANFFAENLF